MSKLSFTGKRKDIDCLQAASGRLAKEQYFMVSDRLDMTSLLIGPSNLSETNTRIRSIPVKDISRSYVLKETKGTMTVWDIRYQNENLSMLLMISDNP